MNQLVNIYLSGCSSAAVEPKRQYVARLDALSEAGAADVTELVLRGCDTDVFGDRLTDDDCVVVIKSLMASPANQIRVMDLRYNDLGDRTAAEIATALVDTHIYTCLINTLCLRGNSIGEEGCVALCRSLERNTSVTDLDLSVNPVGNSGGMALANMLYSNEALARLDIGHCDLGTETVIALATVLARNDTVRVLGLENPRLRSLQGEPHYHVAKMLQVNRTVVELNLSKSGITDAMCQVYAQFLLESDTLQVLRLRCNRIGILGGEALAALLMRGSRLRQLDLSGNHIGDDGGLAFGTALGHNRELERLDITHNRIGDAGLAAVADGLQSNSSLTELLLWGNDFGQEAADKFDALFQGRFKYYALSTDFRTYEVDGVVQIAQVEPSPLSS